MAGQKHAATDMRHSITLAEALAIDRGDGTMLQTVQQRECGSGQRTHGIVGAGVLSRGGERSAGAGARRESRRATDAAGTSESARRPRVDRRAQDADPRVRGLRARRHRADDRARDAGGRGAHEHLRAPARSGAVRRHRTVRRRHRRSPIATRGGRGWRCWSAPRAAPSSPSPASARRSSSVSTRSSPATTSRRGVGSARPRRQAAPDPDRRVAAGRDRARAPPAREHRRGLAPPHAARGGDRRAQLAAAPLGAAAARRRVRAARPGSRQGPAADSRRRRHRVHRGPARVGRLPAARSRRAHRRQPVGRCAARADDERRAVAAAVHGWRERAAWRLHAEAGGGGGRQGGQRRAPDSCGDWRGRRRAPSAS